MAIPDGQQDTKTGGEAEEGQRRRGPPFQLPLPGAPDPSIKGDFLPFLLPVREPI